jgi:hypothetical protein
MVSNFEKDGPTIIKERITLCYTSDGSNADVRVHINR